MGRSKRIAEAEAKIDEESAVAPVAAAVADKVASGDSSALSRRQQKRLKREQDDQPASGMIFIEF